MQIIAKFQESVRNTNYEAYPCRNVNHNHPARTWKTCYKNRQQIHDVANNLLLEQNFLG